MSLLTHRISSSRRLNSLFIQLSRAYAWTRKRTTVIPAVSVARAQSRRELSSKPSRYYPVDIDEPFPETPPLAHKKSSDAPTRPRRPGFNTRRIISTLDPHNLRPSDYFDISGLYYPSFILGPAPPLSFTGLGVSGGVPEESLSSVVRGAEMSRNEFPSICQPFTLNYRDERHPVTKTRTHSPFPPGTHGFLYYHSPPDLPFTAGQLRFRITQPPRSFSTSRARKSKLSSSPQSMYELFESGHDLISHHIPWRIPLLSIVMAPSRASILYHIPGLTQEQVDICRQIYQSTLGPTGKNSTRSQATTNLEPSTVYSVTKTYRSRSTMLTTLSEEFPVDLGHLEHSLWIISTATRQARYAKLQRLFCDMRVRGLKRIGTPYTGMVLVRFERAPPPKTNPKSRHRLLNLRITRILTPIKCTIPDYDGYVPEPVEGGLVARGHVGGIGGDRRGKRKRKVCAWDVDRKVELGRALRLLFD